MISAFSGTACIASHTESWRDPPPATTASRTRRPSGARTWRVRSTCDAGAATTIAATPGWRVKRPIVIVTTGTRPIFMNCFGVRVPKRVPIPPAGMTTAIRFDDVTVARLTRDRPHPAPPPGRRRRWPRRGP